MEGDSVAEGSLEDLIHSMEYLSIIYSVAHGFMTATRECIFTETPG
jgi:hypothetical protein